MLRKPPGLSFIIWLFIFRDRPQSAWTAKGSRNQCHASGFRYIFNYTSGCDLVTRVTHTVPSILQPSDVTTSSSIQSRGECQRTKSSNSAPGLAACKRKDGEDYHRRRRRGKQYSSISELAIFLVVSNNNAAPTEKGGQRTSFQSVAGQF